MGQLKILIVEDDFTSRRIMMAILKPFGACDVAVDGEEALEAFKAAHDSKEPYDLICLDIMMPRMDGQATLKAIRDFEVERKIPPAEGVKVIMTTALGDSKNIMKAFNSQCEAYLVKPIWKNKIIEQLEYLGLVPKSS